MNENERWINLEGPEPEAVRKVFDPLRAAAPSREEAERMERDILEALAVQEDGATPEAALPLDFGAWATLSASLIGAGKEERLDVLDTHDVSLDAWRRCEEHYFRSLVDDLGAGRVTRTDLYAAKCGEAVARRKMLPEGPAEVAVALPPPGAAALPLPEAPAPPLAAAPPEAATFQKTELLPGWLPRVARSDESLTGTSRALELPAAVREQMARLPFVPAPPAPPAPPPGTAKTVQLPAAHPGMGGTLPPGSDASVVRPALPFAEQSIGARKIPFPRWEVITYASYSVEFAMAPPEQKGAIMSKYRVHGELPRQALEEHWRKVLAADPAKRAEFDQRCAEYAAMLRGQAPR